MYVGRPTTGGDVLDVYLLQIFNGLSVSSILLLVALGLAFSFGLMGIINMAHGEFIMIGAYTGYAMQYVARSMTGGPLADWTFLVSLPLAFIVAGAVGWALERLLLRHL